MIEYNQNYSLKICKWWEIWGSKFFAMVFAKVIFLSLRYFSFSLWKKNFRYDFRWPFPPPIFFIKNNEKKFPQKIPKSLKSERIIVFLKFLWELKIWLGKIPDTEDFQSLEFYSVVNKNNEIKNRKACLIRKKIISNSYIFKIKSNDGTCLCWLIDKS